VRYEILSYAPTRCKRTKYRQAKLHLAGNIRALENSPVDLRGWSLPILRYAGECPDMDLGNKEYPRVEGILRSIYVQCLHYVQKSVRHQSCLRSAIESNEHPFPSSSRFELVISSSQGPHSQRPLKIEKQAASDSDVIVGMTLPLIAGYNNNPVAVSLSRRAPRYSRGQGKSRDIARIPARLPF